MSFPPSRQEGEIKARGSCSPASLSRRRHGGYSGSVAALRGKNYIWSGLAERRWSVLLLKVLANHVGRQVTLLMSAFKKKKRLDHDRTRQTSLHPPTDMKYLP